MPTRLSGLGSSGLDIDTLVKNLMKAKQMPIDKMKQQQQYLVWKRDDYRDMNTLMSGFSSAVNKVNTEGTLLQKKAVSSDETKVSATATASALNGNYTLTVSQLATRANITSGTLGVSSNPSQALGVTTTLKLTGELNSSGTPAASVSITATDSIQSIVSKINGQSTTTGISASYDQLSDKLIFNSTNTGAVSQIKIDEQDSNHVLSNTLKMAVSNDPIGNPASQDTLTTNGKDAMINLTGVGNITSRSNVITTSGMTLTLKTDPSGTPYSVNLATNTDVDGMFNTIKSFVDKYNEVIDKVYTKVNEPFYRDYPPLSDDQKSSMKDQDIANWEAKAKSGTLRGDVSLSASTSQMRDYITQPVSSTTIPAGQYSSLVDVGITTSQSTGTNTNAYQEHGKLYIDETKLRDALTQNPDQVVKLFTAYDASNYKTLPDGTKSFNDYTNGGVTQSGGAWKNEGIASRLKFAVDNAVSDLASKSSYVVSQKGGFVTQQINDYTSRITTENSKLADYEQKYYSQFSALDSAITKMNAQGSWLQSQLGGK